MYNFRQAIAVFTVVIVSGCAHPMVISPDISKIGVEAGASSIDKDVGFFVSTEDKAKSVNTPGGGGDSVTYSPYRDMETSIYKMLDNVFRNIVILASPQGATSNSAKPVSYIISPQIKTESSSTGTFTWPPTDFKVHLTCNIKDPAGTLIASPTVTGVGSAPYDEFKSDFSLSGKRAALDAVLKMQRVLLELPELRRN